ncbi:MAG: cadmium-translocating P-type ATPase [Oscillospiraceae bacterium]|nr:cadmium-translocating P-type ATPase [Oscillospiraceae bacterium]
MKTVILLTGLDCPNCAAHIEKEVAALPDVTSAYVDLIQQRITVESGWEENALLEQVKSIVHAHEPHVQVSLQHHEHHHEHTNNRRMLLRMGLGAVIYVGGLVLLHWTQMDTAGLFVLILSYLILGGDVLLQAARNIAKGHIFDENFLMSLSSIVAFCIGEAPEAVAVMLFYQVGEYFQHLAVDRSRRSISDLMDIRPDTATVFRNGEYLTVSPDMISVGEQILIKPGEKIPLDGIVETGDSMLDTRALTGESVPRMVRPGDEILSGCINTSGVLTVRVTKAFGQSTASKILELAENAASRKAPTENFITAFARVYTPVVVILAVLLALVPPLFVGNWMEWLRRGCVFLVISCPCALVISIPLTFFGGIGAASRHGILVKGGNYLEALNKVDTVVFDKTGTLTQGVFQVTEIDPAPGFTREQVLEAAAWAESFSGHPIARSILSAYGRPIGTSGLSDYREIPGQGVGVCTPDAVLWAGNEKLMNTQNISFTACDRVGTKVYVGINGVYAGCIVICDTLKPYAKETISRLKKMGIKKTVMLTGDDAAIARDISQSLGLDAYHAQLLPHQKVEQLESLTGTVAYVGDGINDAPVLARADVGIAMGALGSDAAIEAADVVLMTDEPGKLCDAVRIARATRRIVVQNILIALGIKGVFLILGALGIAGMWLAVFADVGVALIAVANAMRILKK